MSGYKILLIIVLLGVVVFFFLELEKKSNQEQEISENSDFSDEKTSNILECENGVKAVFKASSRKCCGKHKGKKWDHKLLGDASKPDIKGRISLTTGTKVVRITIPLVSDSRRAVGFTKKRVVINSSTIINIDATDKDFNYDDTICKVKKKGEDAIIISSEKIKFKHKDGSTVLMCR